MLGSGAQKPRVLASEGGGRATPVPHIDPRRQKVLEDNITPEQLTRCKTPQLVLELTSGMTVVEKYKPGWEEQTKRAFKEASARYHPDKNPLRVEWATLVFQRLGEAKGFIFTTGVTVSQK
jgi:hypothetical protein